MAELQFRDLPSFQYWEDYTPWYYLEKKANAEIAIVFTKLFLPDTLEYEGGIFLTEQFHPKSYFAWIAELKGDVAAVERVISHVHLEDWLRDSELVGINNLLYLGECIQKMWKHHLATQYPDKQFEVSLDFGDSSVVVTFCQKKSCE